MFAVYCLLTDLSSTQNVDLVIRLDHVSDFGHQLLLKRCTVKGISRFFFPPYFPVVLYMIDFTQLIRTEPDRSYACTCGVSSKINFQPYFFF